MSTETAPMADERRGILTDSEREILSGEKDVSDNYYYTVSSRVNQKIQKVADDLDALEESGKVEDLREIVCEGNDE